MTPHPPDDTSGFVSLFTTVIISLLLLVITTSMVSLEALQLRKTIDAEQSLRAYYTAEAGVEDAVRRIISGTLTSDQPCKNKTSYDSNGSAGWTCQQVTFAGSPTGKLVSSNQAVTIDPGTPVREYSAVLVEWEQNNTTDTNYFETTQPFPSQSDYNNNRFAPPLELTIVRYPRTAVNNNEVCSGKIIPASCKIISQNAVLIADRAATGIVSTYGTNSGSTAFANNSPYRANCTPNRSTVTVAVPAYTASTSYRCSAVISNFAIGANNFLFRLSSKYGPAAYRFTFLDNLGRVVPVNDGMATIDVTAKAGSSFRRTVLKLPTGKSAGGGFNYVIYSDKNICKNFQVIDNRYPSTGPCGSALVVAPTPPPVCSVPPHDIVSLYDMSGSMLEQFETGSKRDKLLEVADQFIDNTNVGSYNHEAIVALTSTATISQNLTASIPALRTGVANLVALTNGLPVTHYRPSLDMALNILNGPLARGGTNERVVVLVTDGQPEDLGKNSVAQRAATRAAVIAKATELKLQNVTIYTIGITVDPEAEDILRTMASTPAHYASAANEAQLTAVMQSIAGEVVCP